MIEVSSLGGDVRFDGETITIRRSSRMVRSTLGDAEMTIPLRRVTGVEWKSASLWHSGHIRFAVPGSQASALPTPVNRDRNAVLFSRKEQAAFEKLRQAVQEAISR